MKIDLEAAILRIQEKRRPFHFDNKNDPGVTAGTAESAIPDSEPDVSTLLAAEENGCLESSDHGVGTGLDHRLRGMSGASRQGHDDHQQHRVAEDQTAERHGKSSTGATTVESESLRSSRIPTAMNGVPRGISISQEYSTDRPSAVSI